MQTDITCPDTVPRVLEALGGRKADLVVCDGAPDGAYHTLKPALVPRVGQADPSVTGVHDLDAHLHAQLILAVREGEARSAAQSSACRAQSHAPRARAISRSLGARC